MKKQELKEFFNKKIKRQKKVQFSESKKCSDCNKNVVRHRSYKHKLYCFNCYQKKIKIIGFSPCVFEREPLVFNISFFTSLTQSQHDLLLERINFLFPLRKENNRPGYAKYIRDLVLNDLEYYKEKLKGGKKICLEKKRKKKNLK